MATTITHLLLLLFSILPLSSSTLTTTITLPLSHLTNYTKPVNIYNRLNHLAKTSLTRAHNLKNPNTNTNTTSTPLSPHSYGAYSISLKFGTPPQTIPFIMDTGSSFVWFPCTQRYKCDKCTFPSSQTTKPYQIPFFKPILSSTKKIVGCLNPKCGWIHNSNIESRCTDCTVKTSNCTQICPPYLIIYGSGTTGGLALLETLDLNNVKVPNFFVGCSIFSSRQPAGIAGFGRGDSSVPSQLGLTKFSYCSFSHKFDDTQLTTSLNLTGKETAGEKLDGITYTPLLENPKIPTKESFSEYYYIGLNKILVGGKKVKFNGDFLAPPDEVTGVGGTIIDSGTTFTYMAREIFEPLAREIDLQVKGFKRSEVIENITGLQRCYNVSGFETLSLPSLEFHFKGGAKMVFPLENYFSLAGKEEAVCLTIVTDPPGPETVSGPRVIFGNYQQQNFYVEYDLKHNKLGFKQQKCG